MIHLIKMPINEQIDWLRKEIPRGYFAVDVTKHGQSSRLYLYVSRYLYESETEQHQCENPQHQIMSTDEYFDMLDATQRNANVMRVRILSAFLSYQERTDRGEAA